MNHQQTGRDLIVISDWMCARFVRLGWVQEMDRAKQPQRRQVPRPAAAFTRLRPRPPVTPCRGSRASPASPTTAAGSGGRSSTSRDLWAPDLKGRVTLLSGLDESFALLMQGNGVDITRWTADDFHRMCDQVEKRVHGGHIRRFTGNDYIKDLSSGDVLACQAYSRRRDPAPGRRPGHRVRRARGGRRAVGGVADDPQPRRHKATPRSSSTTTTSRRSPPSWPPGSTTSARSRPPATSSPPPRTRTPPHSPRTR